MHVDDVRPAPESYAILADELEETRKVRDEWCVEYTRVRDELEGVKKDLEFYRNVYLRHI